MNYDHTYIGKEKRNLHIAKGKGRSTKEHKLSKNIKTANIKE